MEKYRLQRCHSLSLGGHGGRRGELLLSLQLELELFDVWRGGESVSMAGDRADGSLMSEGFGRVESGVLNC